MSDHIEQELNLLIDLMQAAKERLGADTPPDTLYKLAFSAAEGGRKYAYFEEQAKKAAKKPSYGGGERKSYGYGRQ